MSALPGIIFAVIAVAFRLLPHPANFTPMGALFIFFGARMGLRWSALALAALALSDLAIGTYDLRLMLIVYASFAAMGLCAKAAAKGGGRAQAAAGILAGSLLFYVATNFAVWALSPWYPHTPAGLLESYTLALPFFRNSLLGDFIWSGIFLGAHAWFSRRSLAKTKLIQIKSHAA